MKRREFVKAVGRSGGLAVGAGMLGPFSLLTARPAARLSAGLLIPMDDAQSDHLKAYGLAYRAVQAGGRVEWFLNYRGGSFLLPDADAVRRDAALNGIAVEPIGDDALLAIRGEIAASNMDAVPLEKAPRVAVYVASVGRVR